MCSLSVYCQHRDKKPRCLTVHGTGFGFYPCYVYAQLAGKVQHRDEQGPGIHGSTHIVYTNLRAIRICI